MVLQNNDKIVEVKNYDSFFKKLIGFMFQKKKQYAIYFKNCSSVHTFFCFFPLDIYLLDQNNHILYTYKHIKANRMIGPKKGVHHILEVPSHLIENFTIKND